MNESRQVYALRHTGFQSTSRFDPETQQWVTTPPRYDHPYKGRFIQIGGGIGECLQSALLVSKESKRSTQRFSASSYEWVPVEVRLKEKP